MFVDCGEGKLEKARLYELLLASVLPRPIAWVSTRSKSGVDNLAPFSFFNLFSVSPPILGFSPGLKRVNSEAVPKDSLQNVIETGEFVVNVASFDLLEKMVQTSAEYEPEISEFEALSLSASPSSMLACPRLKEAKLSLECRLFQIIDLGSNQLVLGRILCMHVDDELMSGGQIDVEKLDPVGRLGGDLYCRVGTPFEIKRPRPALTNKKVNE